MTIKRIYLIIISLLFLVLGTISSYAQTTTTGKAKSLTGIEVHFRFDNDKLDLNYMGNKRALSRFAHVIDSLGLHTIDSVVIVSQSSPEGVYLHNLNLSRKRAATMRKTIEQRHPELSSRLRVHPDGESWIQLREYVLNDPNMKQKTINKVLSIIDSDVNIETKKWRLEQQPIFRYLRTTYYPRIRNSMFYIIYFDAPIAMAQVENVIATFDDIALTDTFPTLPIVFPTDSIPRPMVFPDLRAMSKKSIGWALKSNLLYDAALVPNIGAELILPKRWSITSSLEFAWWNTDSWYWRVYGGELAVRKWFGRTHRRPLTGHHIGLYAQALTYDFLVGGRGYQSGDPGQNIFDRASYAVGLEYGYSHPLTNRLRLDFVLGIGYQGGKYNVYSHQDDCYVFEGTKKRSFIGPTKAEVSLVWLLKHRAIKSRKGGRP